MKRSEWLEAGLEPAFGTVDQWITDHLGTIGADEEACYALSDAPAPGSVRILVASDIGLVDLAWHRTGPIEGSHLVGYLVPWREVSPPHLSGETRLSPALIHEAPEWSLQLWVPPMKVTDPVDADALLDFWRACAKATASLGSMKP